MGAALVVLAFLWVAFRFEHKLRLAEVGAAAMLGLLIGLAVWLVDGGAQGQVVIRFLSLASPLLAFLPVVGLPFTFVAFRSRQVLPSTHRFAAKVGFYLSVVVSGLYLAVLAIGVWLG